MASCRNVGSWRGVSTLSLIENDTEQSIDFIANDTPLQLPTFRHGVMPSSQSRQVGQTPTKSHQGNEGGPAAQQHQQPMRQKNGITVTPLLSPSYPPSIPAANSTKQKKRRKRIEITNTSRDSHPPLPCPICPTLATRLFIFLFQTDRIVFLATPDVQLNRSEERTDCARVFLVRMQDPMLLHQSVTPPESWPLAPRNPSTLAITQLLLSCQTTSPISGKTSPFSLLLQGSGH